jgi:exopolysaccharide biosynthesis polyprenyl glycosylphosphotransferase
VVADWIIDCTADAILGLGRGTLLRRHSTTLRVSLMAADAVSAWLLFLVVSAVRYGPTWLDQWAAIGIQPGLLALLYAFAWTATLWLLGLYRMRARWSWRREWVDILRGVVLLAVVALAALFVVKLPNVSRVFLAALFASQAVVTIASRALVRRLYATARSRGHNASFVLVVGDGHEARTFVGRLQANAGFGIRVLGYLASPTPGVGYRDLEGSGIGSAEPVIPDLAEVVAGREPQVLGTVDQLPILLHGTVVDEVAICLPPEASALVEPVARLCEEEGKVVRIPLEPVRIAIPGGVEDNFDGVPVLSLVYGPDHALALLAKRLIDIFGSLAALVVISPLLIAVAGYIALKDGRPVVFHQERVGLHGRPFRVYKFRSMTKDAEDRYEEVAPLSDTMGAAFKMTDDPRITSWGRILRTTSLDELPQFINVLRGEMSIVGPRPAPPREVEGYDVWHRRRLSVKPGITGLWQVEARRDDSFERRAQLDLRYIDRWSLLLDMKIMVRTVPALLQGR